MRQGLLTAKLMAVVVARPWPSRSAVGASPLPAVAYAAAATEFGPTMLVQCSVDAEIAVGPVVVGPADEVHADGVAAGDNRGLVDEERGEPDAGPVRRADANQIARARDDADRGRALPSRAADNAAGCLVVDNDRRIESVAAGGDVIARVVGRGEGIPAVVEDRRTAAQSVGGAGRAHEGNDIELADLKRDRCR